MYNKRGLAASEILAIVVIVLASVVAILQLTGTINIHFWKLSPARDLTGTWEGRAVWHENVENPACFYEGKITFDFKQSGNQLQGTWWLTATNLTAKVKDICGSSEVQMDALTGTVESTGAKFSSQVYSIDFTSTFTTDFLRGSFESCPNRICSDGSERYGIKGEFTPSRKR